MATTKQRSSRTPIPERTVPQDSPAPLSDDGPPTDIDTPGFFERVSMRISARQPDKNVLVNIPIWGWTGDGKTCALLTAIHFCDAAEHPLALALVSNPEELIALETSAEEYKGLNLAGVAAATTERLRQLSRLFIDENQWPPGTDEPSAYIVAVRSIASTLGYAIFPDIKGGSFRELDDTAREVLRKAHAAIVLVNPELYASRSTDGRRYKNDIIYWLQGFAEAQIPVCVMITKADLHKGAHDATDTTHNELTVVLGRQKELNALLCRVSVVGLGQELDQNQLPPVTERNPEHLIKAWIWVVSEALRRSASEIRNLLPAVNIRNMDAQTGAVGFEVLPELRRIGDFSGSTGVALCASGDDPRALSLTFLADSGEMLEATLDPLAREEPQFAAVGMLPEWQKDVAIQGHYIAGEYIVGPRDNCNFVWHGTKGGTLTKVSLPSQMESWFPATSRRIVGIDAAGRLHSMSYVPGKWTQTDYLEGFVDPSNCLVAAFVDASSHVLVYNGSTVVGVGLNPDGHFGTKIAVDLICEYDSRCALTNRLGQCIAVTTSGKTCVGAPGSSVDLGNSVPDAPCAIAIAPLAPLVAVVGPDLRLSAAVVTGTTTRMSSPSHSPRLHAAPRSMIWTPRGELLVAIFDDKTWGVFRPFGLTR